MIWSTLSRAERITALRDKHQPGYSASQLASFFDGATRNAVIGMYHRYADQFTDKPLPPAPRNVTPKPKRLNGKPRMTAQRREPIYRPKEPITVGRPHRALSGGMCKWAVNDSQPGELHLFCAEATDRIYCAYHETRVYSRGTESERSAHRVLAREGS